MKIVCIMGSPKGMKGCTGSLVKPLLESAKNAGAETDIFSLGALKVGFCKSCTTNCHSTGKCVQKNDDFETVLNAMLEADGIIFATPNYNFNVTAQLKALIDRCNFPLHCMKFYKKYVATVVTSGGSDPEVVENYLSSIMTQFGCRVVGGVSGVQMQFEDPEEMAELTASASALGKRMVDVIERQETKPEQEEEIEQAFELMGYLVQMCKEDWPLAYEYWCTNWGIDPSA